MEIITIDGMVEHDFRHSIEDMLRLDQVDQAIERLRLLLKPCAGVHEILPPRFLTATSRDIEIVGWDRLATRLLDHDRSGHRISAIGITLADARALGGPGPARGRLTPFIKTFYFSDDAYAFSGATRDDLLDGYSREGFEWQGDYQATDATLSITGIDDLYGAIIELEDRLLASKNPPDEEIRVGTIGACFVAALIHQALRQTIREKGLPRPLCVLAACDGVYPFFDAPVAGSDECTVEKPTEPTLAAGEIVADDNAPFDDDAIAEDLPGEASLLTMVSRKGLKAPVMVLGDDDAHEAARYSEMAGAQRLGVEEGFVPDSADFGETSDNAMMAEGWGYDKPEWLANANASGETQAVLDQEWVESPLDCELPEVARASFDEQTYHAGIEQTSGGLNCEPDRPEWAAEFDETVNAADPDCDRVFTAPASHSLRARINLAPTDARRTLGERLATVLHRISRFLLRR